MTRKDFILLADALHAAMPPRDEEAELYAWRRTVDEITNALARSNPGFDATRFRQAAGQ